MARLLGIEIPNEKRIEASLPYIYGIGRPTAKKILDEAGLILTLELVSLVANSSVKL